MPRRKPSSARPDPRTGLLVEHRRLRRAFAVILVAAAPASLMQACSAPSATEPTPGADAGRDARADAEHDAQADAAQDALPDASADTADGSDEADDAGDDGPDCGTFVVELDAGADATEPVCQVTLPCGLSYPLEPVGCAIYAGPYPLGCSLDLDSGCLADAYVPTPGVSVTVTCPGCLGGGGRRPRGLLRARAGCAPTAEGAYFARMAHDEAASVHAFRRMRDELLAHGAPPALRRAAARAIRDEERHARAMARHARARGATVPKPRVRGSAVRTLEAIARENAVEGCVNETFGALIAAFQAEHAPSAALRRAFARIAADEARHAALSWAVARWAEGRLDARARARVAAARARAVHALRGQAAASPFDAAVGRPDPAARLRLLDGMIDALDLA